MATGCRALFTSHMAKTTTPTPWRTLVFVSSAYFEADPPQGADT